MFADLNLVRGGVGNFTLLEYQSFKRSYAAEVVAVGEAVDEAQGIRDQIAEMLYGRTQRGPAMRLSGWQVPFTVVTDSKDGHDRLTSDAGVGSTAQKSINLALASIREVLDRPNTQVRWTDGTNMLSDTLTAERPLAGGPRTRRLEH